MLITVVSEKSLYANVACAPWEQSVNYPGSRPCRSRVNPRELHQALLPLHRQSELPQSQALAVPAEKVTARAPPPGTACVSAPLFASGKTPGQVTQDKQFKFCELTWVILPEAD